MPNNEEGFQLIPLDDQATAKKASSTYKTMSKTTPLTDTKLVIEETDPYSDEPKSTIVKKTQTQELKEDTKDDKKSKVNKKSKQQKSKESKSKESKEIKKEVESKEKEKKSKKKSKTKSKEEREKELEELINKINEYIAKFQEFVAKYVKIIFVWLFNFLLKLGTLIVNPIIALFKIIFNILMTPFKIIGNTISTVSSMFNKNKQNKVETSEETEQIEEQDEESEEEEDQVESQDDEEEENKRPEIKATFYDMLELNIIFMDNYKRPLYTKNTSRFGKFSAMEEELIMQNALSAIRECAEFTKELPSPQKGFYAGRTTYDIMQNVSPEDVSMFLGFVKKFPGKYIGKPWKISETFATWIINNAPVD